MPAASTQIDVCNAALTLVGANRIASFDEETAESIVCNEHYERTVRAALSRHPWRFATDLVELGAPLTDTPAGKWGAAFQAPPNMLRGIAVRSGATNIEYDRFGDKIFADRDDGLTIEYVFRAEEAAWPAYFEEAIVHELAHRFSIALARDSDLKTDLRKDLGPLWASARLSDSQQQTARRVEPSRLVAARR